MSEILRKRANMPTRDGGYEQNHGSRDRGDVMIDTSSPQEAVASVQSRTSVESYHTAKTFEVSTEQGGRKLMSEEEVSSLVHNALRRARQATGSSHSISPRLRNRVASSPRSQLGASKPPMSPTKSNLSFPSEGEIYAQSSMNRGVRSPRVGLPPKYTKVQESTSMGDDVFSTPTGSFEHNIDHNVSNISAASSDFHAPSDMISENPTDDSLSEHPGLTSINSSEAIIRRVEAEIANARKAAQEANRRLAGVSAKMELSTADDILMPALSPNSENNRIARNYSMESDNMSHNFGSALNVLAEEFNATEANVDSYAESQAMDSQPNYEPQPSFDAQPSFDGADMTLQTSMSNSGVDLPVETESSFLAKSKYVHKADSVDTAGSSEWIPLEARSSTEDGLVEEDSTTTDDVMHLESEKVDKERYSVNEADPLREAKQAYKFDTSTGVYSIVDLTRADSAKSKKSAAPESFPAAFSAHGNAFMRSLTTTADNVLATASSLGVASTKSPNREVIDLTAVESRSNPISLQMQDNEDIDLKPSSESASDLEKVQSQSAHSHGEHASLALDPSGEQFQDQSTAFEEDFQDQIPSFESGKSEAIEPSTTSMGASRSESFGSAEKSGLDELALKSSAGSVADKVTEDEAHKVTEDETHEVTEDEAQLEDADIPLFDDLEVDAIDSAALSEVMADSMEEFNANSADSGEHQPPNTDSKVADEDSQHGMAVPLEVQEADGDGFELTGFVPSSHLKDYDTYSEDDESQKASTTYEGPGEEIAFEQQHSIEQTVSEVEVSLSIDNHDNEEAGHAAETNDTELALEQSTDQSEGSLQDHEMVDVSDEHTETDNLEKEEPSPVDETAIEDKHNSSVDNSAEDDIEEVDPKESLFIRDDSPDEVSGEIHGDDVAETSQPNSPKFEEAPLDSFRSTMDKQGDKPELEALQEIPTRSSIETPNAALSAEEIEEPSLQRETKLDHEKTIAPVSPGTDSVTQEEATDTVQQLPSVDQQYLEAVDSAQLKAASIETSYSTAQEDNDDPQTPLEDEADSVKAQAITEEAHARSEEGGDFAIGSRKVRFKQRYPVPPVIQKPRGAEDLIKDSFVPHEEQGLFLSKPKRDLAKLLEAATGHSIQRRSNACGALKVLTMQKKNRLMLVRTAGFLDALVFAASAKMSSRDVEASQDARARAVMTIANVAEPKDNRELLFSHPGLLATLVKTAMNDHHESRTGACGALALLAKTPSNREPMAHATNLINVLAMILRGGKNEGSFDEKPSYSADDEGSTDRSYSDDSRSSMSSGSYDNDRDDVTLPTVMSMREQKKEKTEEIVKRGQLNACATLAHLSKHCGATPQMCLNGRLMDALVDVSGRSDDPMHTKCLEILCNLSRFPHSTGFMAKYPGLVDVLVVNGSSKKVLDRTWALRTLQNLSSDVAGKTVLANRVVLEMLSVSVMRDALEEQVAATATLYNLSTEPGAVVPLTNTKNVVATLVHVAHNPDSPSQVRLMACDALATLGLWLQTLAGAGTVPKEIEKEAALPSYVTSGWRRWD